MNLNTFLLSQKYKLKKKIETRCIIDLQRNQCFMNCVWDKRRENNFYGQEIKHPEAVNKNF